MKSVVRVFICLAAVAGLTNCSYVSKSTFTHNKDKSYLNARSIPHLNIPPGVANSSFRETYPVPDRGYPISAEDVNVAPPGLDHD